MKYSEFWIYYLNQHTKPWTRILHILGLFMWTIFTISGLLLSNGFLGFALGVLSSYSCAFAAHLFIERNNPATFKHPIYSIISDFRMAYYFITTKIRRKFFEGR